MFMMEFMATWISKDVSKPYYGKEVTTTKYGRIVEPKDVKTSESLTITSSKKGGKTYYTTPSGETTTNLAQATNTTLFEAGVRQPVAVKAGATRAELGAAALRAGGVPSPPSPIPTLVANVDYYDVTLGSQTGRLSKAAAVQYWSGLERLNVMKGGDVTTLEPGAYTVPTQARYERMKAGKYGINIGELTMAQQVSTRQPGELFRGENAFVSTPTKNNILPSDLTFGPGAIPYTPFNIGGWNEKLGQQTFGLERNILIGLGGKIYGEDTAKRGYYRAFLYPYKEMYRKKEETVMEIQRSPDKISIGAELKLVGYTAGEKAARMWAAPISTTVSVLSVKGAGQLLSEGVAITGVPVVGRIPIVPKLSSETLGNIAGTATAGYFISGITEKSAGGTSIPLAGLGGKFAELYTFGRFQKVTDIGFGILRIKPGMEYVEPKSIIPKSVYTGKEQFYTAPVKSHYSIFKTGRYELPIGQRKLTTRYSKRGLFGQELWTKITPTEEYLPGSYPTYRKMPFYTGSWRQTVWHATKGKLTPIVGEGSSEISGLYGAPGLAKAFLRISGWLGITDTAKGLYQAFQPFGRVYYAGEPLGYNIKPQAIKSVSPKQLVKNPLTGQKSLPATAKQGTFYVTNIKTEVEGVFPLGTELKGGLTPTGGVKARYYTKVLGETVRLPEVEAVPAGQGDITVSPEGVFTVKATGKVYTTPDVQAASPKLYAASSASKILFGKEFHMGYATTTAKQSTVSAAKLTPIVIPSSVASGVSAYIPSSDFRIVSYTSYSSSIASSSITSRVSSVARSSSSASSISSSISSITSSTTSSISRGSSSASSIISGSSSGSSIISPPSRILPSLFGVGLPQQVYKKTKAKRVKFKPLYFASLKATAFGIRGKMPSKFQISTGLTTRPMIG